MTKYFDILGIGVPYLDFVVQIEELPNINQSVPMQDWELSGGGKVPTALVAAQRLGLQTGLVTGIPTGVLGEIIQKELQDEGVDLSLSKVPSTPALSVVISDGATKGRTIFYSQAEVPELDLFQKEADIMTQLILISSIGPTEEAAIHWAQESGIPVMIDADYYDPKALAYVSKINLWIASEHFFDEYQPSLSLEEKLNDLYVQGTSTVIVTLGEKGCWVRSEAGLLKIPAFDVDVVDTTGAGDVFHGAYAFAFLQGWSLQDCAIFACAVAALKCRQVGGRKGIPRLAEVTQFLQERGMMIPDFHVGR